VNIGKDRKAEVRLPAGTRISLFGTCPSGQRKILIYNYVLTCLQTISGKNESGWNGWPPYYSYCRQGYPNRVKAISRKIVVSARNSLLALCSNLIIKRRICFLTVFSNFLAFFSTQSAILITLIKNFFLNTLQYITTKPYYFLIKLSCFPFSCALFIRIPQRLCP
jgi:hypothetical protein